MNAWQRLTALISFGRKAAAQESPPRNIAFTPTQQDGKMVDITGPTATQYTQQGLKASSWVYIGATHIQRAVASVPYKAQKLVGETWEDDPEHPVNRLLKRPNEFMDMGFVSGIWAYHMCLSGNALEWINTGGQEVGEPLEWWPVLPDQIRPLKSRSEWLLGYRFNPTGQKADEVDFPVNHVMHWMHPDPLNLYWGLSPMQAVARAIDTDIAASTWNSNVLNNAGMPPAVIFLNDTLTPEDAMQAQAAVQAQAAGLRNARKFMVLGGASKIQTLALNAQELDWINGRNLAKEEIAGALGVPPILMTPGQNVTFANLEGAKRLFWEDTIVPLLSLRAQGLTEKLMPLYGQSPDEYRIIADTSGVQELQENLKITADTAKVLIDAGFPINAVNRRLGLGFDDIPGGDVPRAAPAAPVAPLPQGKQRKRKERKETEEDIQARRAKWLAELKKQIAAFLETEGDRMAAAYLRGDLDRALDQGLDGWKELLTLIHETVLASEGAWAFRELYKAVAGAIPEDVIFNVLNPNVVKWIEGHTGEMVTLISDTTKADLKLLIAAEVEAGTSTAGIRDRIREKFTEWGDNRAALIARTEVNSAFGAAHQLSAEQIADDTGLDLEKTWQTTGDSRVRADHADMDGETVGLDEAFSNGLYFPGEPNCRCVVTYHLRGV